MSLSPLSRQGLQCVTVTLDELLQLSNGSKQLSLSARRVMHSQAGPHHSRLLGRGMEFAESRRYQPGDDVRNIDWKVTARTGKTHTKLFAAEKERQILLVVDMRSSMFFATKGVFKSVQASLLSGYIAWNAIQTTNRLGGIIFDNTEHFEFRPASGKKGVLPLLECLSKCAQFPQIPSPLNTSIIDSAIENIQRVASPGSLIFIISDFRHLSRQASDCLLKISKHSDLSLFFIYDRTEADLPKNGFYPITDKKHELLLNTSNKKFLDHYQQQFQERLHRLKSLSDRRRILFMECTTEDDCLNILKHHYY